MLVTLTPPDDGQAALTAYRIEFAYGPTLSSWTEELTSCDGAGAQVLADRACLVPMATIEALPLAYGTLIQVRA